jgi:hypothetical protein
MTLRHTLTALALVFCVASGAYAQDTLPDPDAPRFRVQVFGDVMADFGARVSAYAALRDEMAQGLPPLQVDEPGEVQKRVRALAAKIRAARKGAKRGDIFTAAISRRFQDALRRMDENTWADIADDNPGDFSKHVNDSYPEKKTFSTVPANILALLPQLPADVEYRFLNRHLILLDTRASLIVDWIPFAIQCADGDDKSSCHK